MLRKRHRSERGAGFSFVAKSLFVTLRSTSFRSTGWDVNTLALRTVTSPNSFNILGDHSMKKSLLALAALGTFAGVAHAQSSVTLYGIVDAGFAVSTTTRAATSCTTTDQRQPARQPLGPAWHGRSGRRPEGHLRVGKRLQRDHRQAGSRRREFGRQAYVGLSSQFGTVTLGRQYDSVVDYVGRWKSVASGATYYAAHPGDIDNINNSNRVNNSIKYTSANYARPHVRRLVQPGRRCWPIQPQPDLVVGRWLPQGPLSWALAT